jgi:hypothetical protein
LGATVGEHATDHDLMLLEERHNTIVHQVGGGERRPPVLELGDRYSSPRTCSRCAYW